MPSDRWQPRRNTEGDRDTRRAGGSPKASQHSRSSPVPDRDDDRSNFPNKQRRVDDRDLRRSGATARDETRGDDGPGPSSPRRSHNTRDAAKPPALTIRGVATHQSTSSPSTSTPRDDEQRPRRARSPDLFDRLGRRQDDSNGSNRSRPSSSLRSRLESEASRASVSDAPRRGAAKLAPRGQYDDSGRRIDDIPSHKDSRDRNRGSGARDGIPTSPRKRDAGYRRPCERSASPTADDPRYRAADDEQDVRYRDNRSSHNDRARASQRSPSPASNKGSRAPWDKSSDAYDRYERRRSPPRSSDRYAPDDSTSGTAGTSHAARWGPRAQGGDRDDEAAASRRRRTPSPARSEASNQSRRRSARNRDDARELERDRQRDRPARWRLDNHDSASDSPRFQRDRERDLGNSMDDGYRRNHRQNGPARERRRSPDDRRARTPPRQGRSEEEVERAHMLSRKTVVGATFDGAQPPTGPRRQDSEANQRSVRGGGWQTVRPGSRRERDAERAADRAPTHRNGREGKEAGEDGRRRPQASLKEEAPAAAAIEPPRAEPGEAYESIHQVGEGTYGQVFKARSERTGAIVALKKIRMDSEKDGFPVTAMREIKLLQALRHENVVRLHEMMVTRGSIYMVFEYMEHDLNGILAHPQVQFSDGHLKSLAQQLFSGLDYLHRKAVLHRDLKGSNILLNNQGRLKLADFGLARFYAKRRLGDYTNRVVTLWYRPPELLFGETQYGSEVDMWGAGCIFLELFVKKPVFQSETELGQVQAITDILGPVTKDNWPDVDKLAWYEMVKPATVAESTASDGGKGKDYVAAAFSGYLPESALEVAQGLLTYDPKKRWTAKQALASRYFENSPKAELPAGLLSALEGEWHEYESRRAKRKASGHRGTDAAVATAGSTDPGRVVVRDQQ